MIFAVALLAFAFSFLNGAHGSRNVVSTLISSRAYSPRVALGLTALAEFLGPFLFGTGVAKTIGSGVVDSHAVNQAVLAAALASAVLWNLVTWYFKLPSSSSHALIGGLLGAILVRAGADAVYWNGLGKVALYFAVSPPVSFLAGFTLLRAILWLARNSTPRINDFFKRGQVLTAFALGLNHGSNDGQKSMGIVTLALVAGGLLSDFSVPLWVTALIGLALSLGTTLGGWKLTRSVGGLFFYKIRPMDGFATQVTASLVIFVSSIFGGPVSVNQVIQTSIMGVGAAERVNKVRWGMAQEFLMAWILTIPATMLFSAGIYWLVTRFLS